MDTFSRQKTWTDKHPMLAARMTELVGLCWLCWFCNEFVGGWCQLLMECSEGPP